MSDFPSSINDPAHMRRDYRQAIIPDGSLDPDPFIQFQTWFDEAAQDIDALEVNAMTLATVRPDGMPTARTVLLKGFGPTGFCFYTNYNSDKAQHLAANPQCTLLFHWHPFERQLRIEGRAEKMTVDASRTYFQSRPRASQLGAWASDQSTPIATRAQLQAKLDEVTARFADVDPLPLPEFWGGYRVIPTAFEFWQGGSARLHDRIRYELHQTTWTQSRLQP